MSLATVVSSSANFQSWVLGENVFLHDFAYMIWLVCFTFKNDGLEPTSREEIPQHI